MRTAISVWYGSNKDVHEWNKKGSRQDQSAKNLDTQLQRLSWKYTGYEGAMKGQPKWMTNAAFYDGRKDTEHAAKTLIQQHYALLRELQIVQMFELHPYSLDP